MRIKTTLTKALYIVVLALWAMPINAQPPSRTELEKQKKLYEMEISELNNQLSNIKGQSSKLFKQSSLIEEKIRLRDQIIGSIDNEMNYLGIDIQNAEKEIKRLEIDVDTLKKQYAKGVVFAYKNRSNYDFLNFIFSSSNFNNAMKRVTYLKSYRDYQSSRAESITRTKAFLKDKIDVLKGKKVEKGLKYQEQELALKQLETDRLEKASLANEFKAQEGELSKQIAKKRASLGKITSNLASIFERLRLEEMAKQKLKRDAENLAKAERKRAAQEEAKKQKLLDDAARKNGTLTSKPNKTGTDIAVNTPKRGAAKALDNIEVAAPTSDNVLDVTVESKAVSASFTGNKGRLPFPVDGGYIVAGFGPQSIPGTNVKFDNPGISIEGSVGSPVRCIFEGEVSAINVESSGIYTIYIRHGKYVSTYSNVTGLAVNKGDMVSLGQQLGTMASNDDGDGAIEFLISESVGKTFKNVNPTTWIRRK
jgi:murein hydrolase activator